MLGLRATGMVHESELDWTEVPEGEGTMRRKKLGRAADGQDIGASLYELEPDSTSWPLHYHTGNEEAIYVLSGSGRLRRGEAGDDVPLGPGEYVALPADPSGAHQIVNDVAEGTSAGNQNATHSADADEPLRYLMLSTMNDPDVTVYPEDDGVGVFAGSPPGDEGDRTVAGFWRRADAVEYWD